MEEIANIISTIGFPIIAYFLVVKDNKEILISLTTAINKLSISLEGVNVRLALIEKEIFKND